MLLTLASLAFMSAADACVDHTSYDFDLAGARLRDVEIVRSEPGGRSETGRFPDGTTVTVSADYCTAPVTVMAIDAPLDAQTEMRLRQLVGRLDVIAGCPVTDWNAHDEATTAAATAALAGEAWSSGEESISGGETRITLSVEPQGERLHATLTCYGLAG